MVLQSLQRLPAFIAYFCLATVLVIAFFLIYTRITPMNEFELIRKNVPGAAIALGLSLFGFSLPLASAIAHASDLVDCAVWGVVAIIVQIITFYAVRIPVPDLSNRMAAGDIASAIWLGLSSVTAGLLSAASMTL
jgi:putative membrane protein